MYLYRRRNVEAGLKIERITEVRFVGWLFLIVRAWVLVCGPASIGWTLRYRTRSHSFRAEITCQGIRRSIFFFFLSLLDHSLVGRTTDLSSSCGWFPPNPLGVYGMRPST